MLNAYRGAGAKALTTTFAALTKADFIELNVDVTFSRKPQITL
jgi:hypothetical protein